MPVVRVMTGRVTLRVEDYRARSVESALDEHTLALEGTLHTTRTDSWT